MRRQPTLPCLAVICLLFLPFLNADAGELGTLIDIQIGKFSWSKGEPAPRPIKIKSGSATIRVIGKPLKKGQTMDRLAVSFPGGEKAKRSYIVFNNVKITDLETHSKPRRSDAPSTEEISFVFQGITWIYEENSATHYDASTGDEG